MLNANSTATATQSISPKALIEEEPRQIDADTIDDDTADRIFEQLDAADAFITDQQLDLIEEIISHDAVRRAGLVFATMPGRELCKKIEQDRDFAVCAASTLSGLNDAKIRYQELAELLKQVHTRILLALCGREDMENVVADGRELAAR